MLTIDSKLPFAQLVWSPAQLIEFFNVHVLPAVWPGDQVSAANRERVRWTPGQQCVAAYELRATDAADTPPFRVVLTFAQDGRELADAYTRYDGRDAARPDHGPRPAVLLPDWGCLVEFFPHDWQLPMLVRATSPDEMLPILTAALDDGTASDRWRCEVSTVAYRPHDRCVLAYRLQSRQCNDRREAIGKLYNDAAKAARVFARHSGIHAAAADRGLIVPKPLVLVDALNLIVMERLPGTSMRRLLKTPSEEQRAPEMVRRAAAVLATLHSLPFEDGAGRSLSSTLRKVREHYVEPLHLVAPELVAQVEGLLRQLERCAERLACARPCLIHGDFTTHQLLVTDSSVGLVDFDSAGPGDPAIDVGKFMARFRKEGVRGLALAEEFLAEYQAHADADSGLTVRARVCCGMLLAANVLKAFLRAPHEYAREPESSRPAMLLAEARAILEAL